MRPAPGREPPRIDSRVCVAAWRMASMSLGFEEERTSGSRSSNCCSSGERGTLRDFFSDEDVPAGVLFVGREDLLFVVAALGVDFPWGEFRAAEEAQGGVVAGEHYPKLRSCHLGLADDHFGGKAQISMLPGQSLKLAANLRGKQKGGPEEIGRASCRERV